MDLTLEETEKTHGKDSGEYPRPHPFPLVYNILCISCYCRKMIISYLLWHEKRLEVFPGGSKYRSHQCVVCFFWTIFPFTFVFFGSCCFSELFQISIPLQNKYHQGKFPPAQENKHAHNRYGNSAFQRYLFSCFCHGTQYIM